MAAWQPGQPLQIQTERFVMRSLFPQDANEEYLRWWNDAEIQKGFNNQPRNWTVQQAAKHIASFNNQTKFHLGVFPKDTGKLIGFYTLIFDPRQKFASANICLGDKAYWGKKVSTELCRPVMEFSFNILGAEKCGGTVKGFNLASSAIFLGLGFKKEGQLRKHVIGPDGKRTDVFHYGLLKEDWLAQKKARGEN